MLELILITVLEVNLIPFTTIRKFTMVHFFHRVKWCEREGQISFIFISAQRASQYTIFIFNANKARKSIVGPTVRAQN